MPQTNFSGVPKTIGNVFSQEWRDLLKFLAVSKGTTEMPQGIEPMSFRPNNLPPQSLEEQRRVTQLVERNRKEYIEKQLKKKQERDKKMAALKQKEDRLIRAWEKEILNDWDKMKTTAKVRELWTEGIPPKIRS